MHAVARVLEAKELDATLDDDAERTQLLDQHALVLVLSKDDRVGEGAEPDTSVAEARACHLRAPDPEVRDDKADPALHHGRRKADLLVELEGPRLHRERARGRAGLRGLVDDPDFHAQPRQPQGENEAGGSGADDQHGRLTHGASVPLLQGNRRSIASANALEDNTVALRPRRTVSFALNIRDSESPPKHHSSVISL